MNTRSRRAMDEFDQLLGVQSPSSCLSFMYQDPEPYLDSSNTTASTSPSESQYDHLYNGYYGGSEDHLDDSGDHKQDSGETSAVKPAAKRKRENRYKNAPPSVLSRRRAQNRASQRAYRERKDQRIKDLEVLLNEAQQKNDVLSQAYTSLQAEYIKLKTEQATVAQYQAAALAFDPNVAAGAVGADMDLFLYNDTSGYGM